MENKLGHPVDLKVSCEVVTSFLNEIKRYFIAGSKITLVVETVNPNVTDVVIGDSTLDSLILTLGRLRVGGKTTDIKPALKD